MQKKLLQRTGAGSDQIRNLHGHRFLGSCFRARPVLMEARVGPAHTVAPGLLGPWNALPEAWRSCRMALWSSRRIWIGSSL